MPPSSSGIIVPAIYAVMILVLGAILAVYSTLWAIVFIIVFLAVGIPVVLLYLRSVARRPEDFGTQLAGPDKVLGTMGVEIAEEEGSETEEA